MTNSLVVEVKTDFIAFVFPTRSVTWADLSPALSNRLSHTDTGWLKVTNSIYQPVLTPSHGNTTQYTLCTVIIWQMAVLEVYPGKPGHFSPPV